MTRRADPERIFQARRIATRNGLTDYGMSVEDAERWCDAWEIEAASRQLPRDRDYWTVGSAWIAEERRQVDPPRRHSRSALRPRAPFAGGSPLPGQCH